MDNNLNLELTQYQLGLIATAIRERIYASNDGRVSLDQNEKEELLNLLQELQSLSDEKKNVLEVA